MSGNLSLFGFEFKRKLDQQYPSFVPKELDDGALTIVSGAGYNAVLDLDGTVRSEAELITKYRSMGIHPEIDQAIDEIINETMSVEEDDIVRLITDDLEVPDNIKKALDFCFGEVLDLLDFNKHAYEIYRHWYIDGRMYYHIVIDPDNPANGIQELRYIDPRKIRKVREITMQKSPGTTQSDTVIQKIVNEYYIFNDRGFTVSKSFAGSTTGLKIAKDAIAHVNSGLTDENATLVLSYLHKAIKPLNMLRTLEDAHIVYTLSRAPQRRIWYIDVGQTPPAKQAQYIRDMMVNHRNRLTYDAATGNVRDDRRFTTMLDDYWVARRGDKDSTEVTTLDSAPPLTQMDNVMYFQKVLYNSLNVPVSRLNTDALFSLGRATEITRDELKFSKFIARMRMRFAMLFTRILERQVVLKGIMSVDGWHEIEKRIKYDFKHDNYFTELKNDEILNNRVQNFMAIEPLIDVVYSMEWCRKNILKQSDADIEEMDKQIKEESADPTSMKLRMNKAGALPTPDGFGDDQEGADGQPDPNTQQQIAPPPKPTPKPSPMKAIPPKPSPGAKK